MGFVSEMQLEMTIRKIRIKEALGRVVTCEKTRGTSVTVLFLASRAELSNGQAIHSIRAAVLWALGTPHCDGKGMASTAGLWPRACFTTSCQPLQTSGDGSYMWMRRKQQC